MASDDEEYVPSDLDEEAFLQQAYATDEEAYLRGATTGGAAAAGAGLAAPLAPPIRSCLSTLPLVPLNQPPSFQAKMMMMSSFPTCLARPATP